MARYYYYPAWWEPGAHAEFQINLEAWNELPEEYQAAVELAALASNIVVTARYDAKNAEALQELKTHDIQIVPFPDDFLQAAEIESFAIYEAIAARDPDFQRHLPQLECFPDEYPRVVWPVRGSYDQLPVRAVATCRAALVPTVKYRRQPGLCL